MLGRKTLIAMILALSVLPGHLAAQDGGTLSVSDFLPPSTTVVQSNGAIGLANGFQIGTVATLYEHLRLAQWREETASGLSDLVAESDRVWENRFAPKSAYRCLSCGTLPAAAAAPE